MPMHEFFILRFGIAVRGHIDHMFYHELVDDPPKVLMRESQPEVYDWLSENQPNTKYGVSSILLDPYSILTLSFESQDDRIMYRLMFSDIFINPYQISNEIIKRYV